RRPTSGLAPAPSPLVICSPSWIFTVARFASIACASVLATIKSTPLSLPAIIVLTALPPPPPTPITLMRAPNCTCSTNSNMTPPSPLRGPLRCAPAMFLVKTPLKEFAQPLRHSSFDLAENVVLADAEKILVLPLHAVENEPGAGRVDGTRDH